MICIYPPDCTDFSTNGLGVLTPQSCTVTETLNGEYELTLVHPLDENGKWTKLTEGCILRAPLLCTLLPSRAPRAQPVRRAASGIQVRVSRALRPLRPCFPARVYRQLLSAICT